MILLKKHLGILLLTFVLLWAGHELSPFSESFLSYHDKTQPARISQFAQNVTSLQFPTSAKDMNWGAGYPIFTFYAPTAYWITTAMHLSGFGIFQSIKASFLLALLMSGWGMYYLILHTRKSGLAAFVGALLYSSSPWIAVEIFVRGNLAEMWFVALLPWAWLVIRQERTTFISTLLLSLTFTSHNALSLVLFCWVVTYAILHRERRRSPLKIIGFASLASAYFWVPFAADIGKTYASEVARMVDYRDHFLCLNQLWTGIWGYGGSAPGCIDDGQSFMIGKLPILIGVGGLVAYVQNFYQHRKVDLFALLLIAVVVVSIWLTSSSSLWVWQLLSPLQSFQFPWRFITFALFGLCYFAGYLISVIRVKRIATICILVSVPIILFQSTRFFKVNPQVIIDDEKALASATYIRETAVYKVPEYLPRSVDRKFWLGMYVTHPTIAQIDELRRQYAGYKPSHMLYTISRFISIATLLCLLCLTRYTATRKKA